MMREQQPSRERLLIQSAVGHPTLLFFLFFWSCLVIVVVVAGEQHSSSSTTTIFLPRDIAFDEPIRNALVRLRRRQQQQQQREVVDVVSNDDEKQQQQRQQDDEILSNCGNRNHVTLTLVGYKGGSLSDQINQDRAIIVIRRKKNKNTDASSSSNKKMTTTTSLLSSWTLVGVFDGHGRMGEIVSEYTVSELPKILEKKLEEEERRRMNNNNDDSNDDQQQQQQQEVEFISQILQDAFVHLDKTVPTKGIGGCTASIVLECNSKIYVANAGDSISIVASYHAEDDTVRILYITREDKPHLEDEKRRIEEMGGQVYIPSNLDYESSRVVSGQTGLAMSRSIGDWDMTGVIAVPIVNVLDLQELLEEAKEMCGSNIRNKATMTNDDNQQQQSSSCSLPQFFAVSATDGMMDYIKPQELADAFATAFYRPTTTTTTTGTTQQQQEQQHPFTTAEDLILLAAKGWNEEMGGQYRDDIAVSASKLGTLL